MITEQEAMRREANDWTEDTDSLMLSASEFDLSTHNAIVTIHNPATGNHRTFKVSTSKLDGTRFLSLLTGSDNNSSYTSFAIVGTGQYDRVAFTFKKYRARPGDKKTNWEVFTDMINRPAFYQNEKGLDYMISSRCRRCNRTLTHPESLAIGLGPDCAKMS